jgi:L-ascorbate metabolism protein UlaG (beta-lactamase superfamily)
MDYDSDSENKQLTPSRIRKIDDIINELPLFQPCKDTDFDHLLVTHGHYDYETPDEEFNHWSDHYSSHLRVIHLPTLLKWLRTHGVSESIIRLFPRGQAP